MAYFDNMPTINYPLVVNGKTKFINARNITVRAKFLGYVKNTQTAYLTYTIQDGERPETLAHRAYGRADLHWVILLFNEILDPMFEWPLSTHDLDATVEDKYPGKAVFIDLNRAAYSKNGIIRKNDQEIWYEIGSRVTQSQGAYVASGTVIGWDPNLYKVIIRQDDNSPNFKTTANITDPSKTIKDLGACLIHNRSDGVQIVAPIGRVVDINKYSVHHFVYTDTNETVDHHGKLEYRIVDESDPNKTQLILSSALERYAIYGKDSFSLSVGGATREIALVTNYQHEIEQNEAKRHIKVMRSELINVVVKDLRSIFNG